MINARKTAKPKAFTIKNSLPSIRSTEKAPSSMTLAQKVIISVITILALVFVIMTIFLLKYDVKYQVEAKISDLAREYYEDFYYPTAFESDEALAANFLARFTSVGLSSVSLRQMILSNSNLSQSERTFLEDHCDSDATSVTYFPESPYRADSYHTEFNYSCNFD